MLTASTEPFKAKEGESLPFGGPHFGYPCAEMNDIGLRIGPFWDPPDSSKINAGGHPPSFAVNLGTRFRNETTLVSPASLA